MPYDKRATKQVLGELLGLSDSALDAKLSARKKKIAPPSDALDEMTGPEQIEDKDALGEWSEAYSKKPLPSEDNGQNKEKPNYNNDSAVNKMTSDVTAPRSPSGEVPGELAKDDKGELSEEDKRRLLDFYRSLD